MKPSPPSDAEIEAALQIAFTRPTLPRKIDDLITLVSVQSIGKTMIYGHRLSVEWGPDAVFLARQRKKLADEICAEKHMRTAMNKGGAAYSYIYFDRQNRMIRTIDKINKSDCVTATASPTAAPQSPSVPMDESTRQWLRELKGNKCNEGTGQTIAK
jgi:hypothetical protein